MCATCLHVLSWGEGEGKEKKSGNSWSNSGTLESVSYSKEKGPMVPWSPVKEFQPDMVVQRTFSVIGPEHSRKTQTSTIQLLVKVEIVQYQMYSGLTLQTVKMWKRNMFLLSSGDQV